MNLVTLCFVVQKFQKLTAAYSHLKHEDEEDQEYEYDAVSAAVCHT